MVEKSNNSGVANCRSGSWFLYKQITCLSQRSTRLIQIINLITDMIGSNTVLFQNFINRRIFGNRTNQLYDIFSLLDEENVNIPTHINC